MNHNYLLNDFGVLLRQVSEKDLNNLCKWRNKNEIKKGFLDQNDLTIEKQSIWYESYLNNDNDIMFIIEYNNIPVGSVALYNINNNTAEFGRIMIGEDIAKGKGVAQSATRLICKFGFDILKLEDIYLKVFTNNDVAIRVYEKVGFIKDHIESIENKNLYHMVLCKENCVK